jgi:hypothetical protein
VRQNPLNVTLFDKAIARWQEILLSADVYSAKEGTAFFVEINYLLEHGYRIVSEGWKLVR